jgi:hypothetical protein
MGGMENLACVPFQKIRRLWIGGPAERQGRGGEGIGGAGKGRRKGRVKNPKNPGRSPLLHRESEMQHLSTWRRIPGLAVDVLKAGKHVPDSTISTFRLHNRHVPDFTSGGIRFNFIPEVDMFPASHAALTA